MTDATRSPGRKDVGTLIVASLFIGLGLITLYDVTTYSDSDSVVFPTFVAYALIFFSVLVIIYSWLWPSQHNGFGSGDWWRRLLLVVTMLAACLFMPFAGFLPATAIAFVERPDRRPTRRLERQKRFCLRCFRRVHYERFLRTVPLCAGSSVALSVVGSTQLCFTYFRQSCSSLNPSISRILRFE